MYTFENIPIKELNRVEYYNFLDKRIYTTLPWINFIAEDQRAEPIILRISNNGTFSGYFTGLIVKKFGLRILGSPFRGWSTSYMGFDLYDKEEKCHMLPELIQYAFMNLNCHYIELADRDITFEQARSLGLAFYIIESLQIDISKTEQELFKNFKSDGRNFYRQFAKRGAKIEECVPDDFFAEEFYQQLKDVFAKQSLVPTWDLQKVERLLKHLADDNMVLCLRAIDTSGKSIATGIFPGFNNEFYFWGGASYRKFQNYRPNEGIQFNAIKYWKNRGVSLYNMVGVRDYKMKFGPTLISFPCFTIAKYPILLSLRNFAEKLNYISLKVKGLLFRFCR